MWCQHGSVVLLLAVITGSALADAAAGEGEEPAAVVSPSLRPWAFEPLPLGSIKPAGWLQDQLRLQASGLSGHVDEFWPDIKDSAWFGGKAEGWERVPYWLDGVVPLAYLLDDPRLEARVKKSIDIILEHQQADGWLGPVGDSQKHKPYDVWPLFPLFKALTQYQEATGDSRIVPALLKCCHKIDELIAREPLSSWGKFRVADLVITLYWLHDKTHERWLLDLAGKAFAQGHDWRMMFEHFPVPSRTRTRNDLENHGVNTGMGLKYGGLRYRLTGDRNDNVAIFGMLDLLDEYHCQATGVFTCDEHLAGRSPSQGTELCTVVEEMYSLELLTAIQGDPRLADRLEKIAYNALPATFKKDMTAHQYDQQANQVICSARGEHVYVSNGPESNLFGLEPNFGCCTANMHQGWPKFVSHLWMKTPDGGLVAVAYAPCTVATRIQGKPVQLTVNTAYPFREEISISVTVAEAMTFPIHLRVPGWVARDQVVVRGPNLSTGWDPGGLYLAQNNGWSGTQTFTLVFPMRVRLYMGYNYCVAIERGPLVYALPIAANWTKFRDRENVPFDDWEVYPVSPWNYAIELDRAYPARSMVFDERAFTGSPFTTAGPPVFARIKGRRILSWGLEKGAAAPPAASSVTSREPLEVLTLIPYGCTDLRITEFPTLASY